MIGNPLLGALLDVISTVLQLYYYVIIIAVIVSWLLAFGVINKYNSASRAVMRILEALTEPILGPIRRIIPPMGGLDLSPLVALLIVYFLRNFVERTRFGLGV